MNSQTLKTAKSIALVKDTTTHKEVPANQQNQARVFSVADMWNIQKQRKTISRRWVA